MRKVALLLTTAVLGFTGFAVAAPPAHACVEIECYVECVRSTLNLRPNCPR